MLEITIPEQDLYIESKNEFVHISETKLQLEHSLISLRKWEGIHHKAFLEKNEKTQEEVLDYVRCMTLNRSVKPEIYMCLTDEMAEKIAKYIDDPRTAAKFSNTHLFGASRKNGEFVSAETIYYQMISLQIPIEFEKWHLNQLLALITFVGIKNGPKKKMSAKEEAAQRAALNASRKAKYHTRG